MARDVNEIFLFNTSAKERKFLTENGYFLIKERKLMELTLVEEALDAFYILLIHKNV